MKHEIRLHKAPSLLSLYTRALLKRGNPSATPKTLPTLVLSTGVNSSKLSKYNSTCQITPKENILPPFYPQVLAFKLHLELLLNKQLPFAVMGLVHRSNKVEYFTPIFASDTLDIKVSLNEYSKINKGINCTLLTEVYVKGQLKWQAQSTYFYRQSKPTRFSNKATYKARTIPNSTHHATWSLAANLGRQYARVTGDLNPIHLFSLSAKLFGFKQTILHGMCMAAKATAQSQSDDYEFPFNINIVFNKPVYLPSTVGYIQNQDGFGIYPKHDKNIVASPLLSGQFETNMSFKDSNVL